MKQFPKWAEHHYSMRQKMVAFFFEGILFLVLLPFLLINVSSLLDRWLQLPRIAYGVVNPFVGILCGVVGLALGLWSVETQVSIGRGTPVPVMPTQTLVVQGPFRFCRNPMTLGTIFLYLGISIGVGSLSAVLVTLLFAAVLLTYIKTIEEKELEIRFGSEYVRYKEKTPFLIPHLLK